MTEPTTTPEAHAEELLGILQGRDPASARMQAEAMLFAATASLVERNGAASALAAISDLAERVRAAKLAQVSELVQPADLVGPALAYLRGLPVEVATQEASAAAVAANSFLAEVGAVTAVLVPAPAPERLPAVPPERLACALVDQLRGLHRGEAHERARATVAGAAAYLHETFGRSYTAALLDGTLQAAAEYGDTARGGRDSLDMLH